MRLVVRVQVQPPGERTTAALADNESASDSKKGNTREAFMRILPDGGSSKRARRALAYLSITWTGRCIAINRVELIGPALFGIERARNILEEGFILSQDFEKRARPSRLPNCSPRSPTLVNR